MRPSLLLSLAFLGQASFIAAQVEAPAPAVAPAYYEARDAKLEADAAKWKALLTR